MPTATLSSKGQITIPQEVRQRLGLKTGDRVEFMYQPDGNVTLKTKKIPFEQLRGIIKSKRRKPLTQREIDNAIASAVTEKYFRVLRQGRSNK
jgi:AbrB family looped-hinge helix DNA binding protein